MSSFDLQKLPQTRSDKPFEVQEALGDEAARNFLQAAESPALGRGKHSWIRCSN